MGHYSNKCDSKCDEEKKGFFGNDFWTLVWSVFIAIWFTVISLWIIAVLLNAAFGNPAGRVMARMYEL